MRKDLSPSAANVTGILKNIMTPVYVSNLSVPYCLHSSRPGSFSIPAIFFYLECPSTHPPTLVHCSFDLWFICPLNHLSEVCFPFILYRCPLFDSFPGLCPNIYLSFVCLRNVCLPCETISFISTGTIFASFTITDLDCRCPMNMCWVSKWRGEWELRVLLSKREMLSNGGITEPTWPSPLWTVYTADSISLSPWLFSWFWK